MLAVPVEQERYGELERDEGLGHDSSIVPGKGGTHHSKGDEGPCARGPAVSQIVIHRSDKERHRSARAGTDDRLGCESGRNVAREGIDDVRVRREINGHHCMTRTI